ncbi:MAG: outer membrane protein assembly factor BamD [Desulfobacteraceae bacterium]|nr:outer membrane protein assembly factor BamD [Desulfobacteraceae bacterium]MBC2754412.1 outer membrane protein assembly factor BamD [Desulfobacteraceae bacterium]
MKRLNVIGVVLLLVLAGCSWSKNKPEKTADELAADGQMYFEKEKYSQAIKSYKKLKDWYPFSVHAKGAGLQIADSYYLMESYDEAILAYNEYERMHPNDEKIPHVIYQVGLCDFDRIETIDRDATATQNALRTFQRLVEQFPDNDEYARQAKSHIETCLQNLAAKEMDIGLFYFKSKKYEAALHRFAGVVTVYPDFGLHHKALDYMAKCKAMIPKDQETGESDSAVDAADNDKAEAFDHGPLPK